MYPSLLKIKNGPANAFGFFAFLFCALAAAQNAGDKSVPLVPTGSLANATVVELFFGEARAVKLQPVARIAVGNGKIISATMVDASQLLLLPESVGVTSIHIWYKNGRESDLLVNVVPAPAKSDGPAKGLRNTVLF